MRKRDLLRYIPGVSKVAKVLDHVEASHAQLATENQQLRSVLSQLIFTNGSSLLETEVPRSVETDGASIPAAPLRFLVAGTADLEWFLRSGQRGAQALADILARQGKTLSQFKQVLDFGCGCGRILRHLRGLLGTALHGTDPNPWAIQWCEKHLDFVRFRVGSLEPPLPYPDDSFDLIYAFSIFTHLTEPLQIRWVDELRRVLTRGGYLLLTVHGDACAARLPPAGRARYREGKLVVLEQDVVGSNFCSAFHPEAYVRKVLTRGFDVVDFIPEGAKGNPPQDAYLMMPSASPIPALTRGAGSQPSISSHGHSGREMLRYS